MNLVREIKNLKHIFIVHRFNSQVHLQPSPERFNFRVDVLLQGIDEEGDIVILDLEHDIFQLSFRVDLLNSNGVGDNIPGLPSSVLPFYDREINHSISCNWYSREESDGQCIGAASAGCAVEDRHLDRPRCREIASEPHCRGGRSGRWVGWNS